MRKTKLNSMNKRLEISEEKIEESEDIAIKPTQNGDGKMTWWKRCGCQARQPELESQNPRVGEAQLSHAVV